MNRPKMILTIFITFAFASSTCTSDWAPFLRPFLYTTPDLISRASISSVCPTIYPAKIPGLSPQDYLLSTSCLGYLGPLGPQGPLGILGPLGNNTWNPSTFINGLGNWTIYAEEMTGYKGPLGIDGPLGFKGPISELQYYGYQDPGKMLFNENDFAVQMRALGL